MSLAEIVFSQGYKFSNEATLLLSFLAVYLRLLCKRKEKKYCIYHHG